MGLNILVIFNSVNMKRLKGRKTSKSLRFVNIYRTELIKNLKKKSSLIRLFWNIGVQNSFCQNIGFSSNGVDQQIHYILG